MMNEYEDDYFLEEDKIAEFCAAAAAAAGDVDPLETKKPNQADATTEVSQAVASSEPPFGRLVVIGCQNLMGMTVTSGSITVTKDAGNLIGISIGGGPPNCPCLYIVQVFDNTPAAKEGTLQGGDELVAVDNQPVKGKTKVEVAKMIQACQEKVVIAYNKLHADPQQGNSLDIVLKKVKHRFCENMSTATADALGLSRAILCNDSLVKKLDELERTEAVYRGLVLHAKNVLKAFFSLLQAYKAFGETFGAIGNREPSARASEAFRRFGEIHRSMEKDGVNTLRKIKPVLTDLGTYLNKAIPDTRLTINKYADTKFEYLSYCLKVKEMDDEEVAYNALQEPLYRVETGNYEYRLILRCRGDARARFARLRSDVLVKLELLDNKHVQDTCHQLARLASGLSAFHAAAAAHLAAARPLFPVEVDLRLPSAHNQDGEVEEEEGEETCRATEATEATEDRDTETGPLLPGLLDY